MCNLKGLIQFCALAMMFGTASAQIQIVIDNQVIPTADIESIVILPNSNLISVTTTIPYTVMADNSPPPPGDVVINSFSVSSSTITEGQSVSLSWTTANASSCTPTGGTGGWNSRVIGLPNSNTTITITSAGTYTFGLTCQGASGNPVTRSIVVTAQAEPPPDSDPSSCGTPSLSGNVINWINFWQEAFPFPGSDTENIIVPIQGYSALKFNSANFIDDGKITSIETTNTTGVRFGAISECPGNFDVPSTCSLKWGLGGGIRWATNDRDGACQLKPNTTYYFNITFTNGVTGSTTTCPTTPCVTALQHSNR